MSLVNDMLKDLELRNAAMPDRMPEAIAIPVSNSSSANPILLLALVAMVIAVAGYLFAQLGTDKAVMIAEQKPSPAITKLAGEVDFSQPDVGKASKEREAHAPGLQAAAHAESWDSEQVLNDPAASDIVLANQLASLPAPAVGKNSLVSQSEPVSRSAPDNLESRIAELLMAGENALAAQRLTRPANDNALDYFKQALQLAPDNPQAHAGIDRIVDEYIKLIQIESTNKNVTGAQQLLARALAVNASDSRLQQLQQELATVEPSVNKGFVKANTEKASREVDSAQSITRRSSLLEEEQQILTTARQYWSSGNINLAVNELRTFVERVPTATEATLQLFDWYGSTSQWSAAEQLLAQSQKLSRSHKAFMSAQLLVQRQQVNDAIKLLQDNAPPLSEFVSYHAYLAGLYQKQGMYREAANHYRQLLSVDPKQATFWLGLGVALDALKDKQALQAYLQIGNSVELNAEVRRFVLQRIQALSS